MDTTTTFAGRSFGQEGRTTRAIERQTSKAPSGVYLTLAIGSMIASAAILVAERTRPGRRFGRRFGGGELANFVGHWAPTFLVMGLYNKLVKIERELVGQP